MFLLWSLVSTSRHRDPLDYDADSAGKLWLATAHFLNAFFEGTHPMMDRFDNPWPEGSWEAALAGQTIHGGFFGVLWSVTGDLEFLAQEFDLGA